MNASIREILPFLLGCAGLFALAQLAGWGMDAISAAGLDGAAFAVAMAGLGAALVAAVRRF